MSGSTYRISYDHKSKVYKIKCLICGMTSWHRRDVETKYCGRCHKFHDADAFRVELEKLKEKINA